MFTIERHVHWGDTDTVGVVWFGNYFRFLEEAEDDLFRALGRTKTDLARDHGVMLPRIEASCRYRGPARADDVVRIGIQVEELTERRANYRFEVRDRGSDRLLAEGTCRIACVRSDTFKAIDFPEEVRTLLERAKGI
jgi:acyl-CoA thioester hydrolase